MKICFVIPTLTSGGAERVAVTVLSALDSRHERMLYLFSGADGVYFDRIAPGVRVVVASKRSWLARLLELARFLRTTQPDIVMPFLSYFITAIAVWLSRVPARVVFNQGTPTTGFLEDPDFSWQQPLRRRVFAWMTRFFYRRADAVVVTSQGVADDLATRYGVPRAKLRVLHNPVDLEVIAAGAAEALNEPAGEGPVVVAVGRLAGVKNYPLLLAALEQLNRGASAWSRSRPSHRSPGGCGSWGSGRTRGPRSRAPMCSCSPRLTRGLAMSSSKRWPVARRWWRRGHREPLRSSSMASMACWWPTNRTPSRPRSRRS